MESWTDPRYAELVARFRREQESPDPDVVPIGLVAWEDDEPRGVRGFIMEPLD